MSSVEIPGSQAAHRIISHTKTIGADYMGVKNVLPDVSGSVTVDVLADGRSKCYKARDSFFVCVDSSKTEKETSEVGRAGLLFPTHCKSQRAKYEKACRSAWVHHFDKIYGTKKKVQQLIQTQPA